MTTLDIRMVDLAGLSLLWAGLAGTPFAAARAKPSTSLDIPVASYPARRNSILGSGELIIMANVPTLQRVAFAPQDVLAASLEVTLTSLPADGSIAVYRKTDPARGDALTRADFDSKPIATLPMSRFSTSVALPNGARRAELTSAVVSQDDSVQSASTTARRVFTGNREGHLYYGDKRLRLWGCVRPQLPNAETADRIAETSKAISTSS